MCMKTFEDIKKIAVLGAGTMGPGIAQVYAMGGYTVTMWTRSESTREKAIASLKAQLDTFEAANQLKEDKQVIMDRINFALTVEEAVAGADMIQETIVEKVDAKQELYAQLAACVPADTIIASNTSALNIFEIVPEQLLPQMIICHWYAPPHVIPLVEVVKSEQAPQEMADTAVTLLNNCGKTAVLMKKFIRGYIANRLQQCLNQEVFYLLENGGPSAEDVADNPHSYPSKQNLACDPLNMATERATVCLFLRGDMKEGRGLEMNPEDGSMTVSSPLTCGIFRNEGEGKAGVLNAVISGAPASIWVSSLDSKPVANSERMLLVHLTDVQGENVRYSQTGRAA